MEDTVRIYRNAPSALNPDTGIIESGQGYVVYEGAARIYSIEGQSPITLGDGDIQFSNTNCSIPITAESPRIDDTVEVLTHKTDSSFVGKSFRVTSASGGGYLFAYKRLGLMGISENRNWTETYE